MTAPSVNIAGLLNTAGIATSGSDLFVGSIPDEIRGFAILILDSGGPAPVAKYTRDYKDIQIIVRGDIGGYLAAWSKAEEIKDFLLAKDPLTIVDEVYASFLMRSDITFTGYDPSKRPMISLNFRLVIDGPNKGNRLSIE